MRVLFPVGRPVTHRNVRELYGIVQYECNDLQTLGVKWVMKDGAGYDVVSEHDCNDLIELEWCDESE
jgi:hypothetical protein